MRNFLLLALLAASCMPRQAQVAPRIAEQNVIAGRKLFRQHCAKCHGLDAAGTRHAPNLRAAEVRSTDQETLFRFITDGDLRNGMPAWSRLPGARRQQIVAYLKSLHSSPAIP